MLMCKQRVPYTAATRSVDTGLSRGTSTSRKHFVVGLPGVQGRVASGYVPLELSVIEETRRIKAMFCELWLQSYGAAVAVKTDCCCSSKQGQGSQSERNNRSVHADLCRCMHSKDREGTQSKLKILTLRGLDVLAFL